MLRGAFAIARRMIRQRRRGVVENGGYRQWLEENRSGVDLTCDECGREDGSHAPGCGWRLIG